MRWTSVRTISATPDRVFRAVADPEEFQRAIPGGASVEYLTASRSGMGMKRPMRPVTGRARLRSSTTEATRTPTLENESQQCRLPIYYIRP